MTVAEARTAPTADVLRALGDVDWDAAAAHVRRALAGVEHVVRGARRPFPVDPVPRVVDGAEWDALAAGLAQRVRALEAHLRDPGAGVVPPDVAATSIYRGDDLPPPPVPVGVAGPDLARAADGSFVVLEDNLRTPTLMGYALAAAEAVRSALPVPPGLRPPLAGLADRLLEVLRAAAPEVDDPVVAVLGDPRGSVRSEPERLARAMSLPLVDLAELTARGDRLLLPDGRAVDVLWRRTSEERLRDDAGRLNALGEALLPGLASGRLRVVNPFGTGVADDKRTHRYVEDLVRHHLGEEPLLRSVRTWDLAHELDAVRDRLDALVLKPRQGSGGWGVTMPPVPPDVVRRVLRDPSGWVAQEPVALSTCPALVGGRLVERHVDLRPCVLSDGAAVTVLDGGLTRVALVEGERVVNCGQGGAGKDTWVVDTRVPVSPAGPVGR